MQTIIPVLKTSNSEISNSLLIAQQRSWHKFWYLYLDIYIFPLEKKQQKNTVNNPPTPSEIASFWTPSPRNFCCPSWGIMDVFWNYTGRVGGREAIEEKKNFKILQQNNLLTGQKYKCKLQLSPFRVLILATDSHTFIFCKHYFSRITFMFNIFCLFCRDKMLVKGNDTCPVE